MLGITLMKGDQQIHTFNDWDLIPKTRFNIDPPEPKYLFEEIQGSDAIIDLTESLTGYVCYKMRKCEITFTILKDRETWSSVYSAILNFVQGEELKVIADEDPQWYWKGRFHISDWETTQKTGKITLTGTVEPYKISVYASNEDWIWDDFDFELGVIRDYRYGFQTQVGDTDEVFSIKVVGSKKHVVPIINYKNYGGSGSVSFMINAPSQDGELSLVEGDNRFPQFVLGEGEHDLYFHVATDGTPAGATAGQISVNFEVGSL